MSGSPSRQQVPTESTTIERIMASPRFEQGVDDVRAGRGYPPDYDAWAASDKLWAYERGRQWARVTPRHVKLKVAGKVTKQAIELFVRCCY